MNELLTHQPLVTILTATTGNPLLERNLASVEGQTYENIQHLVVIDGPEHTYKFQRMPLGSAKRDVLTLPYATGKDRFNGHRIYGACTYLAKGQFVMFLDDDNSIESEHVAQCMKKIKTCDWVFAMRNIIDGNHGYICQDNCESLGKYPSILGANDYFVDVNCYFLPHRLALMMSPVWFRRFREPGQMEIDRAMLMVLKQLGPRYESTGEYSVNYTVGNSPLSVQKEFFLQGNEMMLAKYNGALPWVKDGSHQTDVPSSGT